MIKKRDYITLSVLWGIFLCLLFVYIFAVAPLLKTPTATGTPPETMDGEYTNGATLSLYTPITDDNLIEIKVENGGTETITGLNRNVMKLGAMTAGTDAPAATELVRVYATDGTILGSGLWSEYLAGTMTIKRDNLTDPDVIIGRIAYTIAGVTRASQQMTPATLMNGATLNFTVMSN